MNVNGSKCKCTCNIVILNEKLKTILMLTVKTGFLETESLLLLFNYVLTFGVQKPTIFASNYTYKFTTRYIIYIFIIIVYSRIQQICVCGLLKNQCIDQSIASKVHGR